MPSWVLADSIMSRFSCFQKCNWNLWQYRVLLELFLSEIILELIVVDNLHNQEVQQSPSIDEGDGEEFCEEKR